MQRAGPEHLNIEFATEFVTEFATESATNLRN